jgi:hypothetical protein
MKIGLIQYLFNHGLFRKLPQTYTTYHLSLWYKRNYLF